MSEAFKDYPGDTDTDDEMLVAADWYEERGDSLRTDILRNCRELERLAEETISTILQHPELFGITFNELFEHMDGEVFNSDDMMTDWDPSPSLDDDQWVECDYSMNFSRDESGTRTVTFGSNDGNDFEVEGEFTEQCDDYQHMSAMQNCHYKLAKGYLYMLHICETGDDPLNKIWPKTELLEGEYLVTLDKLGDLLIETVTGSEDVRVLRAVESYVVGRRSVPREFNDILEVINDHPHGRDGSEFRWKLESKSDTEITLRVTHSKHYPSADQTEYRMKQAWSGLDNYIRSSWEYVHEKLTPHLTGE